MSEFAPVEDKPQVVVVPIEAEPPKFKIGALEIPFIIAIAIVVLTYFAGFFYLMGYIN